ncbi:MAG: metallopeptidase TldD-related protein [Nitriliruptoraceae bacterium]
MTHDRSQHRHRSASNSQSPDDVTDVCSAMADDVAELVRDAGAEGNVVVTRTHHGLTRFANSSIHQHVGDDSTTITLSIAVAGRSATASTTTSDLSSVGDLVTRTITAARQQPVDNRWPGPTPQTTNQLAVDDAFDAGTADASPAARADAVRAFVGASGTSTEGQAGIAPFLPSAGQTDRLGARYRVTQATSTTAAGYLDTEATWTSFASTTGHRVASKATRATIDGIHRTVDTSGAAHHTSWQLADLDPATAGIAATTSATWGQRPIDIEPGDWPVVLGPEAVASVIAFLGAYGFNAKAHLDGASFVNLGEACFDPAISLWEDPFDPRAVGLRYDAQGVARQRYPLIDQGVTVNLAHDRRTALRAGVECSTGNALLGAESWGAIPMNPVLRNGTSSLADLVAGVERGLYIARFHYCRVLDPKTQVVTGLTRNGTFLIERGTITTPVTDLRFTQSFVDALAPGRVIGVANDNRYADSEFGPGMVIAPSVSLARWSFTGGASG